MTFDGEKITEQVGKAWDRSPVTLVVAFGFLMILGVYAYNNYVGTNFLTEGFTSRMVEIEDATDVLVTQVADFKAFVTTVLTDLKATVVNMLQNISDQLAQERERAKLFRDEVRAQITENLLKEEARETEFWAGIGEQFKAITSQNGVMLDRQLRHTEAIEQLLERIEALEQTEEAGGRLDGSP